ncbi:hypothetical protein CLF_112982, partial [Clonorchis sinensis]
QFVSEATFRVPGQKPTSTNCTVSRVCNQIPKRSLATLREARKTVLLPSTYEGEYSFLKLRIMSSLMLANDCWGISKKSEGRRLLQREQLHPAPDNLINRTKEGGCSCIIPAGRKKVEIIFRIRDVSVVCDNLRHLWRRPDTSLTVKGGIYLTTVRSTPLYGTEDDFCLQKITKHTILICLQLDNECDFMPKLLIYINHVGDHFAFDAVPLFGCYSFQCIGVRLLYQPVQQQIEEVTIRIRRLMSLVESTTTTASFYLCRVVLDLLRKYGDLTSQTHRYRPFQHCQLVESVH